MSKASEFLEELQKAVWQSLGHRDDTLDEAFKRESARVISEMADTEEDKQRLYGYLDEALATPLPNAYEEPLTYALLLELDNQLREGAAANKSELPERPVMGTLPLGEVNACAIRVPGEAASYLVLFHHGLFGFANLFAKVVGRCFPGKEPVDQSQPASFSYKPEDIEREINETPEILYRLNDLLDAYLLEGDPHKAKQYLLGEPHAMIARMLRSQAELFVLGHEYGHIVAGHFDGEEVASFAMNNVNVPVIPETWDQEFEADFVGLLLMLQVTRAKFVFPLAYWGVEFFFGALDIVQRALGIIEMNDEELFISGGPSHPGADARREHLRDAIRCAFPKEAESAIQLSDSLRRCMAALWAQARPHLTQLHEDGAEVSKIWTVRH
jgi:hypothetical protein